MPIERTILPPLAPFFALLLVTLNCLAAQPKKIVFIAGPLDSHPPDTHEYEKNIILLAHCLDTSPGLRGAVRTELHFNGWPENPATLDDADTIVLTSGGSDQNEKDHPLYVGDRLAQIEKQMRRGCGLVFLHWSTFHPVREHDRITEWVGGYFDYERGPEPKKWFSKIETREWTATPVAPAHPITRGVQPFALKEEFYFNIRFRENDARLTPILVKDTTGDARENCVAWAVERAEGGRGFGFTGGHFFQNWSLPDFRRLVLNAIAWSAHVEVPAGGVESSLEPPPDFSRAPGHKPPPEPKPASTAQDSSAAVAVEKQTEKSWADNRWSQTVLGPFQSSSIDLPTGTVLKALSVRLGEKDEAAVCYDTATGNLRAGWTGGFLRFDPARYGITQKPVPAGTLRLLAPAGDGWLGGRAEYRGLSVNGARVVVRTLVDGAEVRETPWIAFGENVLAFTRSFSLAPCAKARKLALAEIKNGRASNEMIDGIACVRLLSEAGTMTAAITGDSGAQLRAEDGKIVAEFPANDAARHAKIFLWSGATPEMPAFARVVKTNGQPDDLAARAQPGAPRWQPLTTRGQPDLGTGAYLIDTLTAPYNNPWKALLFFSGVGFLPNGDLVACTIHGDVWLVSGVDEKLTQLTWRRFATGLFQPLGLVVRDGKIYVLGRDQITQLIDQNGDGEADDYECFSQKIDTSGGGHDFVTSLQADDAGNFYYVDPLGVHCLSADGRTRETLGTGWRNPNGMSVSADGKVITVAPQEGNWTPSSAICEVRRGGFYGFGGPRVTPERPLGYDAPLCWIPHSVDNSTGSQVWAPKQGWGPLSGQLLNLSYGGCLMQLVLRDEVNGVPQGGVVPVPGRFLSGAMRGVVSPRDQQLYVAGTRGWQTAATRDGSIQRVRFTGKKMCMPGALRVHANGLALTFTEPLDRATAEDAGSYAATQWNYRYAETYGSKEYSVAKPDAVRRDPVEIKSARLLSDGRTVFLETAPLQPVMQMRLQWNVNTADGATVRGDLYHTINRLRPTFVTNESKP